jgi:hypothetical protein
MKRITLIGAITFIISGGIAFAQSNPNASVRIEPGHFCSQNKCVRFSGDLSSVSIQGRRPVSVASYGLRTNPVISSDAFREVFRLALRQSGVNGNRD